MDDSSREALRAQLLRQTQNTLIQLGLMELEEHVAKSGTRATLPEHTRLVAAVTAPAPELPAEDAGPVRKLVPVASRKSAAPAPRHISASLHRAQQQQGAYLGSLKGLKRKGDRAAVKRERKRNGFGAATALAHRLAEEYRSRR